MRKEREGGGRGDGGRGEGGREGRGREGEGGERWKEGVNEAEKGRWRDRERKMEG